MNKHKVQTVEVFHLFEDGVIPCIGTNRELFNIFCDCQMRGVCLKCGEGWVFSLFMLTTKTSTNISATQSNNDKGLGEGKTCTLVQWTVIKDRQNTQEHTCSDRWRKPQLDERGQLQSCKTNWYTGMREEEWGRQGEAIVDLSQTNKHTHKHRLFSV